MSDVKFTLTMEGMAQATASIQKLDAAWDKLGKGAGAAGGQAKAFGQELFSKLIPAFTVASLAADGIRKVFGSLKDQFTDTMGAAIDAEKVDRALESALAITGQAANRAAACFKNFASVLQRKTVYDDEAIKSAQALMIQMGLSTGVMDKATKGAIGLASVFDMDLQSAARAVAQGFEGNYKAIGMMIPAVREATTEGEKHAAMMKGLGEYYQRAESDVTTFAGKVAQVKNVYNDLQETLGNMVIKNKSVLESLDGIKSIILWLDTQAKKAGPSKGVSPLDFFGPVALWNAAKAVVTSVGKEAQKSLDDYAKSWEGWTASFLDMRRAAIDPIPIIIREKMILPFTESQKVLVEEMRLFRMFGVDAGASISNAFGTLGDMVGGELGKVINYQEAVSGIFDGIGPGAKRAGQDIKTLWEKATEDIRKYQDTAGAALGALDGLFQQSTANRMIGLDNEYQRRLAYINASITDETARAQALDALDAEFAEKRKGPLRAVWLTSKAVAISNAIMSMHEAQAKALAQGGFWAGPVMMAIVRALGVAQIALIAGQKMPLARGALFSKPTLLPARYEVAEAGSAEIVSPVPMMRSIVREELQIAAVAGPSVTVYMTIQATAALSDAEIRRLGSKLKREVDYQFGRGVGR